MADPLDAPRPPRAGLAAGRPPGRALEEGAGRLRRREGPALGPGGMAARRARRRGRRGARHRRRAWDRGKPNVNGLTEVERGVGEILIEEDSLQARIRELGRDVSADYAGRELLLVGVLKGAVFL